MAFDVLRDRLPLCLRRIALVYNESCARTHDAALSRQLRHIVGQLLHPTSSELSFDSFIVGQIFNAFLALELLVIEFIRATTGPLSPST